MARLKPRFGSRHPSSSGFPALIFKLVPVRSYSRQAHSFLYLAMYQDAASLAHPSLFLALRKGTGPNQLLR
jgi:hypothetical protein